jgi:hypothetical protein
MALITLTNQVASQSLRGENCKITVDLTTQSSEFAQLQVGQQAVNNSGYNCYVYSVDTYGNSFELTPLQPDFTVGADGYVLAGADIDVTI